MRKEEQFIWSCDELFKDLWEDQKGLILGRGNNEEYQACSDLDRFNGKIIGCNTAYKATHCHALVWMDESSFFRRNKKDLFKLKNTLLFGVNPFYQLYGLNVYGIEAMKPERCSESFDSGFYPCTLSGYVALNIGLLMGLNPIWLYGFERNEIYDERNKAFEHIAIWAESHNKNIYVAQEDSSLRCYFSYKPLIKNYKRKVRACSKSKINCDAARKAAKKVINERSV